jgi:hypothetical protein
MLDSAVIGGGDIDAANLRGWALYLSNINGGEVSGNLIADGKGGNQRVITLACGDAGTMGVLNLHVHDNVRRGWKQTSAMIEPGPSAGTTILDLGERADLAGFPLHPDAFRPGFLAAARAGQVTASEYLAWARPLAGLA